jgi:hypothetical protein
VLWTDSSFIRGWQYPDAGGVLPEPRQIRSLGWLVAIADDAIVLAPSQTRDEAGVLNSLAIPRGCIVAFEEVPNETS